MIDTAATLGSLILRTPLVAASGTVGSVVDFAAVGPLEVYGAAVAKSVSGEPWPGLPEPRLAPAGPGMLNGIGIQNPGIEAWMTEVGERLGGLPVPVWGSAVGVTVEEYVKVAKGLEKTGVQAVELNLSCPNLESGTMFALDRAAAAEVVAAVRGAIGVPVGAKLSPNAADVIGVAEGVAGAGCDWVVLTNTIWGAGIDVRTRRPLLHGMVGGYSGGPLKPVALRCVWEVNRAIPELPIIGCGGVQHGEDVVEYLLAGARAVALGTVHFAEPRAGRRVLRELMAFCKREGVREVADLIGAARPW